MGDLTSPRNTTGTLPVLRGTSIDSINGLPSIPGLPSPNKGAANSPYNPLSTLPSIPRLKSTTSLGSVLSFRGLSDPMHNLAAMLSMPQTPQTPSQAMPHIGRNISDISLLSNQGNSHFVPYNPNSEYFAPMTPKVENNKNKKISM